MNEFVCLCSPFSKFHTIFPSTLESLKSPRVSDFVPLALRRLLRMLISSTKTHTTFRLHQVHCGKRDVPCRRDFVLTMKAWNPKRTREAAFVDYGNSFRSLFQFTQSVATDTAKFKIRFLLSVASMHILVLILAT